MNNGINFSLKDMYKHPENCITNGMKEVAMWELDCLAEKDFEKAKKLSDLFARMVHRQMSNRPMKYKFLDFVDAINIFGRW